MFAIVQTNKKTEWQKIQQTRKMGRKDSSQKAPSFLTLVFTKPKLLNRIDSPQENFSTEICYNQLAILTPSGSNFSIFQLNLNKQKAYPKQN